MKLSQKMKNSASVQMHDVVHDFKDNVDGLLVKKHQHISDEWLDGLKESRIISSSKPAGDMHRVASVPAAVVEKWLNEGFDVYKESPKAILRRLRNEDMGYFITTNKSI